FGVDMNLFPGAINNTGNHIDFDLGNQATMGLAKLHSHHEVWMASHGSKTYATSFVLRFTAQGVHYVLSYQLRPHNNATKAGAPAGVDWFNDENEGGSLSRYVTLNAVYFGTPPIDGGWTNVDIDWAGLANWVKNVAQLWPELDVNQAGGWCGLQF